MEYSGMSPDQKPFQDFYLSFQIFACRLATFHSLSLAWRRYALSQDVCTAGYPVRKQENYLKELFQPSNQPRYPPMYLHIIFTHLVVRL